MQTAAKPHTNDLKRSIVANSFFVPADFSFRQTAGRITAAEKKYKADARASFEGD
jgi:hypothetical protein